MRTFPLLMQKIEQWRRKCQEPLFLPRSIYLLNTAKTSTKATKKTPLQNIYSSRHLKKAHPPMMLAMTVVSLTIIVGYPFYNQPQLAVDTLSPVTITSPRDGLFPDPKTTEEKRKEILTGMIPVLRRDPEITAKIEITLSQFVGQIEQLRRLAGAFPFVEEKILPLESQQYLRSSSVEEWQQILTPLKHLRNQKSPQSRLDLSDSTIEQVIYDLKTYRQRVSQSDFESLLAQIYIVREQYARAWAKFLGGQPTQLSNEDIVTLLSLSDQSWQETKKLMLQTCQKILIQGVPRGMPTELLQETISIHLASLDSEKTQAIATQLLLKVLSEQPNLTVDKQETKHRAEQAAQAIEPVMVEIKRGQVIVQAGQKITQENFVVLDALGLSRRSINWVGLGFCVVAVSGAVGVFCLVAKSVNKRIRRRDHLLLCLLSLSTPLLVILGVPYTDLPAIGLLVSSFYSPILAIAQVSLLAGLATFSAGIVGCEYLIAGAGGGLLAAFLAGKMRSRDELARLGVMIGLTQGGIYLVLNLIGSAAAGTIWYAVLPGAVVYGLSGVAWSVVALGISPYLERFFDVVTPIRLAELSNPNCPLLKRLAIEAPGTFQHTLFVACLAEAAARKLHCNVELVRAGTLYHDIGKMHDPLGFIENQMGNPNKHDQINDPWKSAEIIKKHVSEGLVMARKHGLPQVIQDFIPEHQGTLLISYFYFQAKHQAEQNGKILCESDFRYDGPIPQSRETGILMLADSCEAALRSLKEATPEMALSMINKIFKARWRDNQLTNSGIKYEELPMIAEIFVVVWQQFHHQRIAYPKAALEV